MHRVSKAESGRFPAWPNGAPPWEGLPVAAPLYREKQLREIFGLSTTRLYEMMAAGAFPRPIKIGPRAVAWCKAHVDAWLNDCAERTAPRANKRRRVL